MDTQEFAKLEEYINTLKVDIRQWERKNEGKNLNWEEMQSKEPRIAKKYRKYRALKKLEKRAKEGTIDLTVEFHKWHKKLKRGSKSKSNSIERGTKLKTNDADVPVTPTKPDRSKHTANVVETGQDQENHSPEQHASACNTPQVIGPTPQLNGRVLGLFDIQLKQLPNSPTRPHMEVTSPKKPTKLELELFKTPTKGKNVSTFKTPQSTRRRLQFDKSVDQTPSYLREMTQQVAVGLDYTAILSDLSDFSDSEEEIVNDVSQTPIQKEASPNTRRMIEPSPLIKRKPEKSLFVLSQELKALQQSSQALDAIMDPEPEEQEEAEPEKSETPLAVDPMEKYRNKVKTIKRTTRRVKMKTQDLEVEDDELEGVDIHQRINELKKPVKLKRPAPQTSEDEEESEEEEEETYTRKYTREPPSKNKSRGKHPLSNNFVRLKINMHHGGRFKRRRR